MPDRCADVIQKIEDLVQRYMSEQRRSGPQAADDQSGGGRVVRCAQTNDAHPDSRRDGAGVQAAGHDVARAPPAVSTCMYFNNLDAPLPSALRDIPFDDAVRRARGLAARATTCGLFSWLFSPPGGGLRRPSWTGGRSGSGRPPTRPSSWSWRTTSSTRCPTRPSSTTPNEPVPLLSPEEWRRTTSDLVKICSPARCRFSRSARCRPRTPSSTPSWTITAADPPAYLVMTEQPGRGRRRASSSRRRPA